jgi:hypothetical protein
MVDVDETIQARDEARHEDRALLARQMDIDRDLRTTRGWKHDELSREKQRIVLRRSELRQAIDDHNRSIFEAKRLARVKTLGDVPVASLLRDAARRAGHLEQVYMHAVAWYGDRTEENVARLCKAVKRAMVAMGEDEGLDAGG